MENKNVYPIIKFRKDTSMVVMFTKPNTGVVVDNFKGNIKGYESNEWDVNDSINIETILKNLDVKTAIYILI